MDVEGGNRTTLKQKNHLHGKINTKINMKPCIFNTAGFRIFYLSQELNISS